MLLRLHSYAFALQLITAAASCARIQTPDSTAERIIASPAAEARALDADIAFYEQRLTEDPLSAADHARLGALYLRRSRERASALDVERAMRAAERSLGIRNGRNESAYSLLVSARLAGHDFVGAHDAARELVRLAPDRPTHRAMLGEVLLELGRYPEADAVFQAVEQYASDLAVAPRLVRWYEVTGHLARARVLSVYILRRAHDEPLIQTEQLAWFHLRAGDIAAKGGDLRAADSLYSEGLLVRAGDHRLLAARARIAARTGRWRDALAYGEAAMITAPDPATLGVLRDASVALGDTQQSAGYATAMGTSALGQPGPIHRAWGMHLVDHGERVEDVLRRVREELATRQDVYGYDLEAWALHVLGRHEQAWVSARKALSQGTEDEQLLHHAAVIARSLGLLDAARALEARADALAPRQQAGGAAAPGWSP
jgi:tetratricopeptide (TPR) repeat protein